MKAVFVKNTKGSTADVMVSTMVMDGVTYPYLSSGSGACSFLFSMNKEQTTQLAIALMQAAGEINDDTPSV